MSLVKLLERVQKGDDAAKILILIRLMTEASGVISDLVKLLERVQKGDPVTDEEITAAATKMHIAVDQWDEAAGDKTD